MIALRKNVRLACDKELGGFRKKVIQSMIWPGLCLDLFVVIIGQDCLHRKLHVPL